jgi:hypothetical protein
MALDTLRRLDADLVREVVPRLADHWPDQRRARERPTGSRIADLTRRWLDQPHAVVDLLVALERSVPGEGRRTLLELRRMESEWTYFSHAIANLQDPRTAARSYRRLSELFEDDGLPAERDRENVTAKWRRQLEALRSPAAISEVLRAYAAWDADEAAGVTTSAVDIDAVVDRVARGGHRDRSGAVNLSSTLLALGLHEPARLLARAVGGPGAMARMDLRSAARLLDVLVEVDDALAQGLGAAAWERVAEESRTEPSISVAQHADLLGWLAFQARRLGQCPAGVRGVVPEAWHCLRPGQRGWAAGCLPWATDDATDAFQAGSEEPPDSPADTFTILFLAARFGQLHRLLRAGEDDWMQRLSEGRAGRLVALLQMGAPQLRSLLERHSERLRAVLRPGGPGAIASARPSVASRRRAAAPGGPLSAHRLTSTATAGVCLFRRQRRM